MEAEELKSITDRGRRTKVVAVGIGSGVSEDELNNIASEPKDRNVILVQNVTSLTDVEEQLGYASCSGLLLLLYCQCNNGRPT